MKLLCLHGYGTNAECFKNQLLPTINALGTEPECVFVEGEMSVGKSVFTGDFDPPYWAYYEDATSAGVAKAHQLIDEAIETDGPFDGIVGFSQGSGLAISYLLHHQMMHPNEPPKFKFGLFYCTSFVLSPNPKYKQEEVMDILNNLTEEDLRNFHTLIFNPVTQQKDLENAEFMKKLGPSQRSLFKELGWTACCTFHTRMQLHINDKVDFIDKLKSHEIAPELFPRFFHPVYTSERLRIPTVHVWGRADSDPLKRLAILGKELCSAGNVFSVEHPGRHELPLRREDAAAAANAIEKAFYIGQQQAVLV